MRHAAVGSAAPAASACSCSGRPACAPPAAVHMHMHRAWQPWRSSRRNAGGGSRAGAARGPSTLPASALPPGPPPYKFDLLPATQRNVLAQDWGFDTVGESLPTGLDPQVLQRAIPAEGG